MNKTTLTAKSTGHSTLLFLLFFLGAGSYPIMALLFSRRRQIRHREGHRRPDRRRLA